MRREESRRGKLRACATGRLNGSTAQRLNASLLLLCCLLTLRCGAVGEPRPPLLNVPERAQDLTATQTAEGIVLQWTWPRMTTEGMPLDDLARFEVDSFELAPGSPAPDAGLFERESRPLAAMQGDELKPYAPGDRVRLVLEAAPLRGKRLALAVRAESRRGRSVGFSDVALLEITELPGRPGQPSATLERDAIALEWPPAERADSYIVERSSGTADHFEPVGQPDSNRFRDPGYQVGETYSYRVRAVSRTATGGAEGPSSEAVRIIPRDVFPPARPAGLRAVATETAVQLSWEQNTEPDLAGYRVRRLREAQPLLLNEELLAAPSYSDERIQRGETYRYEITAVDDEGNESPGSDLIEVSVP